MKRLFIIASLLLSVTIMAVNSHSFDWGFDLSFNSNNNKPAPINGKFTSCTYTSSQSNGCSDSAKVIGFFDLTPQVPGNINAPSNNLIQNIIKFVSQIINPASTLQPSKQLSISDQIQANIDKTRKEIDDSINKTKKEIEDSINKTKADIDSSFNFGNKKTCKKKVYAVLTLVEVEVPSDN